MITISSTFSNTQRPNTRRHDAPGQSQRSPVRTIIDTLSLWFARVEQRRQLLEMDSDRLRDLGLTRADAVRESLKGFWEK